MESLCPLMDSYLDLVDHTEAPTLFHRWCFISVVSALLHRRTRIQMATGNVFPNQFVVLIGPPGARKSTAINMASELIRKAGYKNCTVGRVSPEQFLVDLKYGIDALRIDVDNMNLTLDAKLGESGISHTLIQAGELQDFLGTHNVSYLSLLTNLWDNPADYPYRTRSGAAELIKQPAINLLGGATHTTFKKVFPLDVLGQGLLSRFILVHGAGSRKKIWMPPPLDAGLQQQIVTALNHILIGTALPTEFKFTEEAAIFSRALYEVEESELLDHRFQHYTNRRNDHYLKLCMAIAAMNFHQELTIEDCFLANTILTYTEKFMPLALGEFGLDHAADNAEFLFQLIKKNPEGMTLNAIVENGLTVFKSTSDIAACLVKLSLAKRIEKITVAGQISYIPITRIVHTKSEALDFDLLREFVENPTFDTEYKRDTDSEIELEMRALKLQMTQQTKIARKEVGKGISGLHILPGLNGGVKL